LTRVRLKSCEEIAPDVVRTFRSARHTVVPEGAVVVPGARAVTIGKGPEWGLSLATPVIVKYRDSRTDTRTELEAWIR
jgi:2,3,4,5-tetrahydropyridine-2-carboxylate N-succinyltransferase